MVDWWVSSFKGKVFSSGWRAQLKNGFVFGRRPNRVIEFACFDSKLQYTHANVNKPSDENVCHANGSHKVKSMPKRKFC